MNTKEARSMSENIANLEWEWKVLRMETDDINPITARAITESINEIKRIWDKDWTQAEVVVREIPRGR